LNLTSKSASQNVSILTSFKIIGLEFNLNMIQHVSQNAILTSFTMIVLELNLKIIQYVSQNAILTSFLALTRDRWLRCKRLRPPEFYRTSRSIDLACRWPNIRPRPEIFQVWLGQHLFRLG
jgi:hypothetical protein